MPQHIRALTFASGVIQTAVVAITTIVSWEYTSTSNLVQATQVKFFGVAWVVALCLNAGILRPYVPILAAAKIAIILGMFFGILVEVLLNSPGILTWLFDNAYLVAAILILFLVTTSFLRMATESYMRNQAAREALLRNQVALAQATKAAEEREQQARRLALIAENTSESIFVTDSRNRIFWTNAAFSQITGYSPQEVMGRFPGDVMDAPGTDPDTIQEINRLRDFGEKGKVEILSRFKDGSLHWISSSLNPVFDDAGKLTMCISVERDVTEEKQRIRELAEAHEQGQAAARAKERFFATMSHEIRTPMNGVLGMADLLSRTPLNDEQRGYLETIKESGDALLGIINDILDLSKLQSGNVQVADTSFNLAEVISSVVALLSPLAQEKGISLLIAGDPPGPNWVKGDSGRLRQILMNLVGNAVKFTGQGSVKVSLRANPAGNTEIEVRDTGIGISADRLEAVFDSFTQADSAINRQFGGTGLGLTICRMLARAMGGDVRVSSVEREGSIFTLSLPLPQADPVQRVEVASPETMLRPAPANQKRILIAEDNGTNRLILRKMLEADHIALIEVVNGAEAVNAYREKGPDLVVMDMQMPIMDGLTAIRHIRADERAKGLPRCPIIVLSANAFPEDAKASFSAGCDEFMTKPVLYEALVACTSRLLGDSVAEQALPAPRLLA